MKQVRTNPQKDQNIPRYILPVIVFSQFSGTSLWFAGNAIAPDLIDSLELSSGTAGYLTSSVQLGFISGTLVFAIFTLADRFSPVRLFAICSFVAAILNLTMLWSSDLLPLILSRFGVGFFLAGIYPVGMKISSDWYGQGLGKALGYLVGALVLGTASPHLFRNLSADLPWENVIWTTSAVAVMGGVSMWVFLKDGPHRKKSGGFDPTAIVRIFRRRDFRNAAFGYFGHMWELYAMWAFVPLMLAYSQITDSLSLYSFIIIGAGALGCVFGGYASQLIGSSRVALISLLISAGCCLLSPLMFDLPPVIFLAFMIVWGFFVVSDSPQFSTIVAKTAPEESRGSALTIVNSIGFAITIPSIEGLNYLVSVSTPNVYFVLLGIGPILGIIASRSLVKKNR